ncbi:MAG TPA: hypothetical protein VGD26_02590, partial [Chitinophagaceae bacterium]
SLEEQLNEAGKSREKLLSESLARDKVAEQIKRKLFLQSERSKELEQIVELLTSARIKAEKEFNEREEELLRRSLAAANEKYEKSREETARLLAAGREELASLLNQLCKFGHKHLKFYPQILSKNEPWLHSNFEWA